MKLTYTVQSISSELSLIQYTVMSYKRSPQIQPPCALVINSHIIMIVCFHNYGQFVGHRVSYYVFFEYYLVLVWSSVPAQLIACKDLSPK